MSRTVRKNVPVWYKKEDKKHRKPHYKAYRLRTNRMLRSDPEAVDQLAAFRVGRGHRVGAHEHRADRPAAEHHMPVPGDREHRIRIGADEIQERGHHDGAYRRADHRAPGSG